MSVRSGHSSLASWRRWRQSCRTLSAYFAGSRVAGFSIEHCSKVMWSVVKNSASYYVNCCWVETWVWDLRSIAKMLWGTLSVCRWDHLNVLLFLWLQPLPTSRGQLRRLPVVQNNMLMAVVWVWIFVLTLLNPPPDFCVWKIWRISGSSASPRLELRLRFVLFSWRFEPVT